LTAIKISIPSYPNLGVLAPKFCLLTSADVSAITESWKLKNLDFVSIFQTLSRFCYNALNNLISQYTIMEVLRYEYLLVLLKEIRYENQNPYAMCFEINLNTIFPKIYHWFEPLLPFIRTGVDYARPVLIGSRTKKIWNLLRLYLLCNYTSN
jgi:hypothetical protein